MNDIDILEEFIKRVKKKQKKNKDKLILQEIEKRCFYGDIPLQAIENLIAEYKGLKEINFRMAYNTIKNEEIKLDNYISKSRVEEELIKAINNEIDLSKAMFEGDFTNGYIFALQSLLGKE